MAKKITREELNLLPSWHTEPRKDNTLYKYDTGASIERKVDNENKVSIELTKIK